MTTAATETTEKLNPYRHFILLAKGWYNYTNVMEGLAAVTTNYLGHDLHKERDRVGLLVNALSTFKVQPDLIKLLLGVLNNSSQYNVPFDFKMHDVPTHEAVTLAILDVFRQAIPSDFVGDLGSPDYTILQQPICPYSLA